MSDPLDGIRDVLATLVPIVASSAGILAGVYAFGRNLGKIRRLFGNTDQTHLIVELRQLAETRLDMYTTTAAQLADERAAHAVTKGERDFIQLSLDQSERRVEQLLDQIRRDK